jgi:hypothetical protein
LGHLRAAFGSGLISRHPIPAANDQQTEALKQRKQYPNLQAPTFRSGCPHLFAATNDPEENSGFVALYSRKTSNGH